MADLKISQLPVFTSAVPATDAFAVVSGGTTKQITTNQILGSGGTATLASATITGAATVGTTLGVTGVSTFAAGTVSLPALTTTGDTNTGIYYPAADTFAVTTGGTESHRANSTGLIRGATTADIISTESTTLTNIGNIGASYGASAGTYFVVKVNAANGIVELKADARTGAAPPMVFNRAGTESMRINTSNNLAFPTGKGIDFSAVTGGTGTATANVLNDYEEGTFVPTVTSVGGTIVYVPVGDTGTYTKIGRLVTFTVNLFGTYTGTFSYVRIALPFTVGAANDCVSAVNNSTGALISCRTDPSNARFLVFTFQATGETGIYTGSYNV